jgi:glycosyltransferase 2 family protein
MLSRLATSQWTRIGLLAVFLGCCGYGLDAAWPQAMTALARLHWYSVTLSLAAAMAGAWCMMLAWRAVLAELGSRLPLRTAARVSFVAQLGKYVPGAVWAFAAHIELGHDAGVPRRRGVAAVVVSLAVAVAAGLGLAALALPLTSPQATRHFWWALAAVPVIALALCPPVLGRLIDRVLTLTARPPLERRPSWGGLARALGWTALGWLALGGQVWLLLAGMTGRGAGVLLLAIGGYALAYAAGLLLVVFPNGIGAREIILIAVLAPVVPHGTALAIAIAARLLTTASDLAWGLFGLAMSRRHARISPLVGTPVPAVTRTGPSPGT